MKDKCRKKVMKKGVILLSGGLDSVTTLYFAKRKGYALTALIFDYNQRHKREIAFAKRIAEINKIKYIIMNFKRLYLKPLTRQSAME